MSSVAQMTAQAATSSSAQSVAAVGSSATPWGAIVGGAASVVNNLVDNIFGAGQKKKAEAYKEALSTLDNQQQNDLNYAILNTQTQTDRMQVLDNAVVSIKQTQLTNANVAAAAAAKTKNSAIVMALVAVTVLIIAMYLLNKQ